MIDDKGWGDGIDRLETNRTPEQQGFIDEANRDFESRTQDGFLYED